MQKASHSTRSGRTANLTFSRSIEGRATMVGLLCSTLCVAYFYLLDLLLFSSRHFSPIFRFLLTTFDFKAAWLGLGVCVLAAGWNRSAAIIRFVDFLGRHPFAPAFAGAVVLGLGTILVYHNYPLSMDEYAGVFQSKVFASAKVFAQLPRALVDWLVVRGFNGSFLTASPLTGRTIGQYWPGFALHAGAVSIFR